MTQRTNFLALQYRLGNPNLSPVAKADLAVALLAAARDLLKEAGATRAVDKVRLALSSAKGAVRAAGYRQQDRPEAIRYGLDK